jgi:hypothetical protein
VHGTLRIDSLSAAETANKARKKSFPTHLRVVEWLITCQSNQSDP